MADLRLLTHLLAFLLLASRCITGQESNKGKPAQMHHESFKHWAMMLETELRTTSEFFTRIKTAQKEMVVTTEIRNDTRVVEEIAEGLREMMKAKIEAVKRIVDIAEQSAQDAKDEDLKSYQYYNAKCLTKQSIENGEPCSNQTGELDLRPDPHFSHTPINTAHSAVHVPTNVFDRSQDVLNAIKWSQELDRTFKENYNNDPSLSWQYFGSATGFMRQFPAKEWKSNPVDLYDCRTRAWYIEAASSPKDIVILVDHSGSMTGVRKEIARHVVEDILDTLGNNDYVNILMFSETTTEVVDCFADRLVQANLANVRAFKQGLEDIKTENIANFSLALERAFELLLRYRENREDSYRGANCNQAIMLITDGVPYNYLEIFETHNFPYKIPVRVFTYLVGREVPDVREIHWMACANRGYYVHLSTQAEVREQVLQYIPVMARPLVLTKTEHPVIWTPVYSDLTDPKMTDWIWERKEFAVQRKVISQSRSYKHKIVKINSDYVERMKVFTEVDTSTRQEYKLMTSVSIPVFDKRDYATRIANLLGVAGTDVPISEIKKFLDPFKLGVGGYAFIVTNNGYILCHPELKAEFHGILKPNYNSVDFVEIEVIADNREPREFNPELVALREKIILQERGGESNVMDVMYNLDDMRRGGTMARRYHYMPIDNTPFTVVISVPTKYGNRRINSSEEIKRIAMEGKVNVTTWFEGRLWRLHPDWVYCKYANESYSSLPTEREFCQFLRRSQQPGWKWPTVSSLYTTTNRSGSAKDAYYCNRDLFLSVVHDARITKWFNDEITKLSNLAEKKTRFGVAFSFIATRSGITRWYDYSSTPENSTVTFGFRAIDEVWYRRAVDFSYDRNCNETFVYSVPIEEFQDPLVTVSTALFADRGTGCSQKQSNPPLAVLGYQFNHTKLRDLFFNTTKTADRCPSNMSCKSCASNDVDCFILDDNGYVIVSENSNHTGQFFGLVDNNVMDQLIKMKLYDEKRHYDYQAVCFKLKGQPVLSGCNRRVVNFLVVFMEWFIGSLLWLGQFIGLSDAQLYSTYEPPSFDERENNDTGTPEEMSNPHDNHQINKTRPEPCDKEVKFYTSNQENIEEMEGRMNNNAFASCNPPFFIKTLAKTNLVFVVVNSLCLCRGECIVDIEPLEITSYNNSLICHKFASNNLQRKRPEFCINSHENESSIAMCGRSSRLTINHLLAIIALLLPFVSSFT